MFVPNSIQLAATFSDFVGVLFFALYFCCAEAIIPVLWFVFTVFVAWPAYRRAKSLSSGEREALLYVDELTRINGCVDRLTQIADRD